MGLFDWFREYFTEDENSQAETITEEVLLSGLNLKQALDAHAAWKERLQKVLDGVSTEQFDVVVTSKDNLCVLGKWIYGKGKHLYSHLPEYEALRMAHAGFHQCAGEVLAEHCDGNIVEATNLLNTKFRNASNKNRLELVRLFSEVKRLT